MRFLTPALFFGAAAGVGWWNRADPREQLAFPFLSPLVGSHPVALGQATVWLLAALGLLTLLLAVLRRRASEPGA